ncbi:MAG: hypothetical protein H8E72_08345 [Candidatus Marinimicrobia bacterium]|nr:hypothetical protein [Candidatus Neomarinimicrobiota bacterium]
MSSLIKILFIFILIINTAFADILQGVALQMTSDGTGFYYKPGITWKQYSKMLGCIGIHLDNNFTNMSRFEVDGRNRSIYLDLSAEFKQELLHEMIAGAFRPVITFQSGSIGDIDTILGKDNLGNWKLKYAIGVGFQFYNVRTLNELTLKYNHNPFTKGNMAFQLAMYWE